ncbi:MAG: endo-1,4-beta-xylanase [Nitrososphaerota archaeon]|nr:endo-1,4-beta-xylanase [Nitrososphaerota archaeon]
MTIGRKTIVVVLIILSVLIVSFGFYLTIQKPRTIEEGNETSESTIPIYEQPKNYTLKELASKCKIMIGTCVSYSSLSDKKYREIISREFSVITPENELKFVLVHPFRNIYTFSRADAIISFAEEHGIKVRGHCLVWHQQLPDWILSGNYTREEWIEILRDHIYTVVRRYKGRLYAWDVVNEAFNDDGTLRDTVWLRNIGPEYIKLAFKWAHEADPDALLFYNDYGAEAINRKSNAIYELVKSLLEEGVPIHGIGLQMHVRVEWYPNPQSVAENIKRFRELGLKVEITEMDVAIKLPVSEEEITKQAEIYKNILKVYLDSDDPQAFIMWGFVDKYSWINYTFPGYGSATIFDDEYRPKPAYYALIEAMLEKIGED